MVLQLIIFYGPILILLFVVGALVRRHRPNWNFGSVLAIWSPLTLLYVLTLVALQRC
jgi:hypothetical protein